MKGKRKGLLCYWYGLDIFIFFTLMQASNAFWPSRCQPVDLEELLKPSILKFSVSKQYHIKMMPRYDSNKRNYDLMLARDI
jgi:hypothetical protein